MTSTHQWLHNTNWRGYRVAAWVGQFLLTIAVIIEATQGNWRGAIALAGFLIASVIFVLKDDRLPTLFDFLFVVAALLNAAGWVWDLFNTVKPYDEITHIYTPFAISLALSFLVYSPMLTIFRSHRILYVLTISSFGIAIGAIWEVMEWTADIFVSMQVIESLDDTINDLIMDSIGAIAAAIISVWALPQELPPESTNQN
ncbi:hypothetical protein Cri9333_3275 [Crinalium epipsammum PCC 9333]|uniref:DUF2238 domain-containing protein n=1 Tax=Crinalium epipsammum PCC 9333 TaxID=1173022 RepID=K9W1N2_9CYAN|nr:hypothetical protein Cri9333_3275 [Crinalium epipsammum PCC 9333]